MDVSARIVQGLAGDIRFCGLWGDTPDGPAECSFGGYRRVGLLRPDVVGAKASWPMVEFGPVSNRDGVTPVGWALFDLAGVIVHAERTNMGGLRRRMRWRISPGLAVEVVK